MSALQTVIIPRIRNLGDGLQVRRALPTTTCRMLGPFVFLDQIGPAHIKPGLGLDVRPHPHIGLATVTWLLQGEILHRDSLGTVQSIRAGEVNWMTAGRGIVHSERTPAALRNSNATLYGLQCWVALPRAHEEDAPDFTHLKASELETLEAEGVHATIIAGSFFNRTSQVPTRSALCYVQLRLQPNTRTAIPAEYAEQALYILEGEIELGFDGVFGAGQLLVLRTGAEAIFLAGEKGATIMLLGGEPLDGPRHIVWNFVSSRMDRIEQAKEDWLQQKFPAVPDETEFIPLPDNVNPAE